MKKLILFGFIVGIIIFSGCGNKKYDISCSRTDDKITTTINSNFKNDKEMSKININVSNNFDNTKDAEKSYNEIKAEFEKNSEKGVTINTGIDGKKVFVEITIDLTKTSGEILGKLSFPDFTSYNKTDFTKNLEDSNFTCK